MSTNISQSAISSLQSTQVSQEQRTKEAKEAFQASLKSSGAAIDHELQGRAANLHANAKALDQQDRKVQKDTKQLTKESDAMEKFLAKSNKGLPDMDGFDADIAKIEADLDMFDEMLDDIEQRDYGSDVERALESDHDQSMSKSQANEGDDPPKT